MANIKVINIAPDGTVRGMHHDDFDLGFLGKKKIDRASEILFDDEGQEFYIALPQLMEGACTPKFLTGFSGYDQARKFEVMVLETAAWSKVEPSYAGDFYALGTMARQCFDDGQREPFRWLGEGRGI